MKHLTILALMLACSIAAGAADKKQEQINSIKKDRSFLYGEATMPTLEDAASLAYETLQKEVFVWASQRSDSPIKSISPKDINQLADTIVARRADMFRVFAYVKKMKLNAMFYNNGIAYHDSLDFGKITSPDSNRVEKKKPAENKETIVTDDALKKIHSKFFNSAKSDSKTDAPSKNTPNSSAQPPSERDAQSSVAPPAEKESSRAVSPSGEERPGKVEQQVIARVKKARNFFDLKNVLPPLKDEGLITNYGKLATAENLEECYLIVYDAAGNIKALLGKGVETRMNLKTGKEDSLDNYRGCGAIWFMCPLK